MHIYHLIQDLNFLARSSRISYDIRHPFKYFRLGVFWVASPIGTSVAMVTTSRLMISFASLQRRGWCREWICFWTFIGPKEKMEKIRIKTLRIEVKTVDKCLFQGLRCELVQACLRFHATLGLQVQFPFKQVELLFGCVRELGD